MGRKKKGELMASHPIGVPILVAIGLGAIWSLLFRDPIPQPTNQEKSRIILTATSSKDSNRSSCGDRFVRFVQAKLS